ncbi:MAG: primosomal protein N' [Betaproteobacteria bacterium]|nr:primosomal protein N' [Betaproteobacteria bacterium]
MPILRVALPVAAETPFDYWAPEGLELRRGTVVRVALGPRKLEGVVIDADVSSQVATEMLSPVLDIPSLPPIPDDVLALCEFVATYYQQPLGMALALAVPPLSALRKRPRANGEGAADQDANENAPVKLNQEQRSAADAILAARGRYAPFLLYGITGSGKTDVYLTAAGEVIADGGQVLLLVPEINLTPQLRERVRCALPRAKIATLHSALTKSERLAHWLQAASGAAQLVLGTRLAIFAPLPGLALMIVDEENDSSYKQQDVVRYHARDVAVWRARRRDVPVLLGSATPSLESWRQAQEGRYRQLDLSRRADPRATLPRVRCVDNRPARALQGIGEPLRAAIVARLGRGEQSLLFINRRGFAPSLLCSACRWEAGCPRCSARLVVHREPRRLNCHHCGYTEPVPASCPSCGNVDLLPLGFGTQRLERVLGEAFPLARIARIDRDSTRTRDAFAAIRTRVAANELDILVGTQMLAKGHDFPRLTLVGVLGADNALYSGDFRATERLAALLLQVAGRAGRAGLPGEVIVQTEFPDHAVYAALIEHDYRKFAASLLSERQRAQLPPYTHVALLAAEARQRRDVNAFLDAAHSAAIALAREAQGNVEVFSPVPALLARRAGYERGQLIVQSSERNALQRFLPAWRADILAIAGRRARWALDVDPAGFG